MELNKELQEAKDMQNQLTSTLSLLKGLMEEQNKEKLDLNSQDISLHKIESFVTKEVNAEEVDGKPKYKNETMRKIAIEEKLSEHKGYQATYEMKQKTHNKINEIQLRIDLLEKQRRTLFSNMKLQGSIIEALRGLNDNTRNN